MNWDLFQINQKLKLNVSEEWQEEKFEETSNYFNSARKYSLKSSFVPITVYSQNVSWKSLAKSIERFENPKTQTIESSKLPTSVQSPIEQKPNIFKDYVSKKWVLLLWS